MSSPPEVGGHYRPVKLLARTAFAHIILVEQTDPHCAAGQLAVVKIARQHTPFADHRSVFFGAFADCFGSRAAEDPLRHEAAALRRLEWPHIVKLLEEGLEEGFPFLTLEWIAAPRLDRCRPPGPWPHDEVFAIAEQLFGALAHAHGRGVVHRDIKPSNLLFSRTVDGVPWLRLIDFELALVDGRGIPGVVGSRYWRAPECHQASDSSLMSGSPQADLYAAGLVLYWLLAGRHPFPEEATLVLAQATWPPPDLQQICPTASSQLVRLIGRLLAKHPDERPTSAAAALNELCTGCADGLGQLQSGGQLRPTRAMASAQGETLPHTGKRGLQLGENPATTQSWVVRGIPLSHELNAWPRHIEDRTDEANTASEDASDAAATEILLHAAGRAQATSSRPAELATLALHRALLEQWSDSLDAAQAALELEPELSPALTASVLALQGLGRLVEARQPLVAAISSRTTSIPCLAHLGRAAVQMREYRLAVAAGLAAHEASPETGAALLPEVTGRLILLTMPHPTDAELLLALATACIQLALRASCQSGSANARQWFRRGVATGSSALALLRTSSDPVLLLSLAFAKWEADQTPWGNLLLEVANREGLLRLGRQVERFGLAVPLDETTPPGWWFWLGFLLLAGGQTRVIRTLLTGSLPFQGDPADVARLGLLAGLSEQVIPAASAAVALRPDRPSDRLLQLVVLVHAHRVQQAQDALRSWDISRSGEGSIQLRNWIEQLQAEGALVETLLLSQLAEQP